MTLQTLRIKLYQLFRKSYFVVQKLSANDKTWIDLEVSFRMGDAMLLIPKYQKLYNKSFFRILRITNKHKATVWLQK